MEGGAGGRWGGVQRYRQKNERDGVLEKGRRSGREGGQEARGGERKKAPCVFLGVITDADLCCHLQHG